MTFIYPNAMGQEPGNSLARWLWLRVPHETVVKTSIGAVIVQRLGSIEGKFCKVRKPRALRGLGTWCWGGGWWSGCGSRKVGPPQDASQMADAGLWCLLCGQQGALLELYHNAASAEISHWHYRNWMGCGWDKEETRSLYWWHREKCCASQAGLRRMIQSIRTWRRILCCRWEKEDLFNKTDTVWHTHKGPAFCLLRVGQECCFWDPGLCPSTQRKLLQAYVFCSCSWIVM